MEKHTESNTNMTVDVLKINDFNLKEGFIFCY